MKETDIQRIKYCLKMFYKYPTNELFQFTVHKDMISNNVTGLNYIINFYYTHVLV